jgi:hypothetical protein
LDFLLDKISSIYTIPPLLIGEDINNDWNQELGILSKIIQDLSVSYPNVEFIDLRKPFISHLSSERISPYVPKSLSRVIWDKLFSNSLEDWEKKASERGLHVTIDGVHLNQTGAEKVAEVFLKKIHLKLPLAAGDA